MPHQPAPRLASLPRSFIFVMGTLAMVMSLPGQTAGVSAFIDPLIAAMGISRAQLSLAYLIGTISSAFMLTPAGKAYDRFGSRLSGTISTAALGLSLLTLTQAPGLAGRLGAVGLAPGVAAFVVMCFGFFLVRFFGQGVMTLVGRTMIMKWYDDRRGFANAIFGSVVPLSFALAPPLFHTLIQAHGMSGAWIILALVLFPGFTLISALGFRDPPENYYGTRGTPAAHSGEPGAMSLFVLSVGKAAKSAARRIGIRPTTEPMRPEHDLDLRAAQKTLAFWVFLLVVTLSSALITGFTFHVVAIFAEAGIGAAAALAVFFPASVIAVAVTPPASIASDKLTLKYFAVLHGLSLALMMAAIPLLRFGAPAYILLVLSKGLATAMFGVNHSVVWPRFFGLRHLGTISGFSAAWFVGGSAVGPYLYSLSYELSGSFHGVALLFIPICMGLALLGFRADNPNTRQTKVSA